MRWFNQGYRGQPPRIVTPNELDSWFEAADARPKVGTKSVADRIRSRNPFRWRRLLRDYRWAQKEMKRMGLNPEDARWLLP